MILGLLVGTIMTGRSLVEAAEMRGVVTQQQQFYTATQTFRDKYFGLPGDITNGSQIFPTAVNGNGDGIVGLNTGYLFPGGPPLTTEYIYFWQELYLAGLITGTPQTFAATFGYMPAKIKNANWWIGYSAHAYIGWQQYAGVPLGSVFAIIGVPGQCGYMTCGGARFSEGLTPNESFGIDSKIDDGKPNTGNVQAASSGNWIDSFTIGSGEFGDISPNLCITGSTSSTSAVYSPQSTNNNKRCNLLIKAGF